MNKQKTWNSTVPEKCDLCKASIADEFIDGATVYGTAWAIMCPTCHWAYGKGLGVGKGQRYKKKGDVWVNESR